MKFVHRFFSSGMIVGLFATTTISIQAAPRTTTVLVQNVSGNVELLEGGQWRPLNSDSRIAAGSVIRTGDNSTVDLHLRETKTALRLKANSKLVFETLESWMAGDENITDTKLRLVQGSLFGAQKKLPQVSHFDIVTAEKVFSITGTEYLISAPGTVAVLEGTVAVSSAAASSAAPPLVVSAGAFLNPGATAVTPIAREVLSGLAGDRDAVKNNGQSFKLTAAKTTEVSERFVSPVRGNNGVGNGPDPAPPGNPPGNNDGPGTGPGNPGNQGGPRR